MTRTLPGLLALLIIVGCSRDSNAWLEPGVTLRTPAASGSRFPHLSVGPDGGVLLSWLEPDSGESFALRYASWTGRHWSSAATIARGSDWFVNWADFPSVVALGGGRLAAHWLQKKPGHVYSYEVRIAVSDDGGQHWSTPVTPHDDDTATEHGFVTLYPDGPMARAVWLDGRQTAGGHNHGPDEATGGAMTLRTVAIDTGGRPIGHDSEIDGRVCDCCQTDAAITDEGPIVVYRDRSEAEIRDIAIARQSADGWSEPQQVHADGWAISACPVNGPAVAAHGMTVAVAWFTAPDQPRVRLAFSDDGGHRFAAPIEVAAGRVAGRVDVVLLEDDRAVVSWLAEGPDGAAILAQPFDREGAAGIPAVISMADVGRASGFPQMVRAGDDLLFAWTDPGDSPQLHSASARLR